MDGKKEINEIFEEAIQNNDTTRIAFLSYYFEKNNDKISESSKKLLEIESNNKLKNNEIVSNAIKIAEEVRNNAYAPYSNFYVGSALIDKKGKIWKGANVENRSYGLTICAERSALTNAISNGERDFVALVVVGDLEKPITPCGACRQFLIEFGDNIVVIMRNLQGDEIVSLSKDILPFSF